MDARDITITRYSINWTVYGKGQSLHEKIQYN